MGYGGLFNAPQRRDIIKNGDFGVYNFQKVRLAVCVVHLSAG